MREQREQEYLAKIAALELENRLLREKIDLLVRKVFGRSKEDLDGNQLELLGGNDLGKAQAPAHRRRGNANRRAANPLLP